MQKITPNIWFNNQAEEATAFYASLFNNSKVGKIARYGKSASEIAGMPEGTALTVEFEIEGLAFTALNGGPIFEPNPSISFFIFRKEKAEMDTLWEKLLASGKELMPLSEYPFSPYYGWVQDKFGLSWQLMTFDMEGDVPTAMPSLLFTKEVAGKANEAIDFYTSVFKDSERLMTAKYGEMGEVEAPNMPDDIAYADFKILEQQIAAMDSRMNHEFVFNEGISLMVNCEDQEEVDYYWEKLSAHSENEQCGWCKDQYGVSWQIVPKQLNELMSKGTPEQSERVMKAMLSMKKLDIAKLEEAYNQE